MSAVLCEHGLLAYDARGPHAGAGEKLVRDVMRCAASLEQGHSPAMCT